MTDRFPPGYRSTWSERAALAKAKLHAEVTSTSTLADFQRILIKEFSDGKTSDFIEAHVYGVINLHSLQKVVRKAARNRRERVIWEDLEEVIRKAGVELEDW